MVLSDKTPLHRYSHKLLLLFLAMFMAHGAGEWLEPSWTWLWCAEGNSLYEILGYFIRNLV